MNGWLCGIIIGAMFTLSTVAVGFAVEPSETSSILKLTESSIEPAPVSELYAAPGVKTKAFVESNSRKKKSQSHKVTKINKKRKSTQTLLLKCQSIKIKSNDIGATQAYVCIHGKEAKKPKAKMVVKRNPKNKTIEVKKIYRVLPAEKNITTTSFDTKSVNDANNPNLNLLVLRSNITNKVNSSIITPEPIKKVYKDAASVYPYLSVVAGASVANIGKDQQDIINMIRGTSYVYDQYSPANNYYSGVVAYGINGGYEFNIGAKALLSLGLGIYQNSKHSAKGKAYVVYRGINAGEFEYEYNLQSTRFMAESQLAWQVDLNNKTKLIPFVLFGVGSSLNFVDNYKETSTDEDAVVRLGFESNTSTSFAYQIGVGIACPLNSNNRLFATYRYVDLGQAHFGNRVDYSYQLDVGKTGAHEVYLGYTHLFGF